MVHLTDGAPFDREVWPQDRAFASRERYARERRREAEAALSQRYDPACLLTHAYAGFHPDHDAAAFIARGALRMSEGDSQAIFLEMATPQGACRERQANGFLPASGTRPLTYVLGESEQAQKRALLACHASQHRLFSSAGLTCECFRPAQQYDFTRTPHAGLKLSYEHTGMPARAFCRLAD